MSVSSPLVKPFSFKTIPGLEGGASDCHVVDAGAVPTAADCVLGGCTARGGYGVSFGHVSRVSSPTEDEPDEPLLSCSASVASTSVSLLLTDLDRMALASGSITLSFSSSLMKPSFFKLSQGLEGEAAWQRGGATAIGSTNIPDTSNVNDVAGGLDAKEPPDRGPVARAQVYPSTNAYCRRLRG